MDSDPNCTLNGSESSVRARVRVRGFLGEVVAMLDRTDVLAFSHMGAMRALIAEVLGLSDADMMKRQIDNGAAFLFQRVFDAKGRPSFVELELPDHVLAKTAPPITQPPAAPPPT
jgi:broad specificity phosphatase PhoE